MTSQQEKYISIDTYKSYWQQDVHTGNYTRILKDNYPLENFINFFSPILAKLPNGMRLHKLLSKQPYGVDCYKYYTEIIEAGNQGKWLNQFAIINDRLTQDINISLKNTSILDISGEPGFFGVDASQVASRVVVTAFASEVASAMKEKLGIESYKYDFQVDHLDSLFENSQFDIVFVRYAIGFCENIQNFFEDCFKVMNQNGILYVSFSPASRGVCALGMFMDYTYLRQYTKKYILETAKKSGFRLLSEWNDGSYPWNLKMHPASQIIARFYTQKIFAGTSEQERMHHNIALAFKKD